MVGIAERAERHPAEREHDDVDERQRFIDAIDEGLADADAGRVHPHAEVLARMQARFGGPRG